MPIVGKPRRTLSEATPLPPPAAPPSIVWPSTGKRTLQRSKVVWGDLTISVGDDVVLDYGASVPGIARVKGFRRKGKGDAATVELLVSWFYVPGDSGTTRTADHYVEEVWKAARETIDAVPVESACYKLRVHDSLEAFEDGHEPDDYFVFGTIRFSKKRDASGAVILRPRVDRQLKPVPRSSDLRIPPPPLKLWSEADRVPLDFGIGFWALRLPDSRMVLPVNALERDEDSLLTAAVYALRAAGGESGAQFCVELGNVLIVSLNGSERVPICSAGEFAIAGALAIAEQCVIGTVEFGGQLYRVPSQPVWTVLQSLRAELFASERVRRCIEQAVFGALVKEAVSSCSTKRIGQRHSVQVQASVLDIAALQPFVQEHAGEWQRGKYCIALTSHAQIPLAAGWHFFSMVSRRERKAKCQSFVYAEVVSPATVLKDEAKACKLTLFTDFKSVVGLRFKRRKWRDVVGQSAVFAMGPAPPFEGYHPLLRTTPPPARPPSAVTV